MKKIYCDVREKKFFADEPCWYQQGKVADPTKICVKCAHYKFLYSKPISIKDSIKIESLEKDPNQKIKRASYGGFLLDFCNVKEWNPDTILGLKIKTKAGYEKYLVEIDSEDDLIPENRKVRNCRTRHDTQHIYCLIENDRSRMLQSKIPETFVLPSQPEFQKLYKYLQKSQEVYKKFLDSCIKGNLDLPYLNNLMKEINISAPMFFHNPRTFSGKIKKREQAFTKWNPVLYLMGKGSYIEDAIESEIVHTILLREGILFSKVKRCINPRCQDYFIYNRRSGETCSRKCHIEYNNLMRKKGTQSPISSS